MPDMTADKAARFDLVFSDWFRAGNSAGGGAVAEPCVLAITPARGVGATVAWLSRFDCFDRFVHGWLYMASPQIPSASSRD